MRILFLDAYFYPEQIAFTHLENDLLSGLVDRGHEVEVICPTPTRGVDDSLASEFKKKNNEFLFNCAVHVKRFYSPREKKNPMFRALRYIWCNIRTYQIGKTYKDIDLVFSNSTPPTQGWIAGLVAKKLKVPFVYSLQDIFPDSLVNAGMTRRNSLIWKVGRYIENESYKNAESIITISDGFKKNIVSKGISENKITVIPNWVDTSEVYPIERNENKIIKNYKLDPSKFYICYSGNIGHSQNLDLLIEVAKKLQVKNPQIEFVIIGDGAYKDKLVETVEKYQLVNIHILPFQPYDDIAHVYSLGDVGLIISKPGIGKSSIPSKTWSIMAAGRPVLASFDLDSMLSKLITELNCGEAVDANKEKELLEGISRLFTNREKLKIYSENGYNYVSNVICKDKCVDNYINVIENAIQK